MCPQPQVKSGLVQSVTPSQEHELYETDGDGTETQSGDIRDALTDVDAPLIVEASPAAWLTATGYSVGDQVTESSIKYICLVAHTSGTFATDLAAGNWEVANYNGNLAQGVLKIDSALDG